MRLRRAPGAPEEELEWVQFLDGIRRGELLPHTQICDRVLSDGAWRELSDTRIFHQLRPGEVPFGPNLVAKLETIDRQRAWEAERAKALAPLREAYCSGALIERALGLKPIVETLRAAGATLAARLTLLPSFLPETVTTLWWTGSQLAVDRRIASLCLEEAVESYPPNQELLRLVSGAPDLPAARGLIAFAEQRAHELDRAPELLRDSERFAALVRKAGDCMTETMDGIEYRFEITEGRYRGHATWSNPDPEIHPVQTAVVAAFRAA